jgi:hypothetical protein
VKHPMCRSLLKIILEDKYSLRRKIINISINKSNQQMCNIGFYRSTRRYIIEDIFFRNIHSCENSNSMFSTSFMFLTMATVTKEYTASILRVSTLHVPPKVERGCVLG